MKRELMMCLAVSGLLLVSTSVYSNSFLSAQWPQTDFEKSTIDIEEIMSGGPPKDGIPAIDKPHFDNVKQAEKWLDAREPVIRVALNGEARAYPLQLLIYHEIVNDQIGTTPISVTFCPLCNSSIVFDRRFKGGVLDFGTTGLLRKSDMVMYDRQTESWWQQILGNSIIGEYAGETLTQIPSSIVSFEDFSNAHPSGKIVNRRTGHTRPYGNNPYRGYDNIDQAPFLFRGELDPRLPPMERVMVISAGEKNKLYPFSRMKEVAILNDEIADTPVVLFSRDGLLSVLDAGRINKSRSIQAVTAFERTLNGQILEFMIENEKIIDKNTGSSWNLLGQATNGKFKGQSLTVAQGGIHFAFAWLAFNSKVEIYRGGTE